MGGCLGRLWLPASAGGGGERPQVGPPWTGALGRRVNAATFPRGVNVRVMSSRWGWPRVDSDRAYSRDVCSLLSLSDRALLTSFGTVALPS